jgi:diguanylate cyclase (GGDEF)-like protein
MRARKQNFAPQGRWRVAGWTVFGTLGCIAFSAIFNAIAFQSLGDAALRQALICAVALPLLLGAPLFLLLSLRLQDLERANRRLNILAATDSLTACLNRHAFTSTVDRFLAGAPQERRRGALLVVDADHFKAINDRFGHDHGDQALMLIASTMRAMLRAGDTIGRLGGEEFGIFLPNVDLETAEIVAERIRRSVNLAVFAPGGRPSQLSVSVGGAAFEDDIEFGELFRIADRRLYEAKQFGRNRVEIGATEQQRRHGDLALPPRHAAE